MLSEVAELLLRALSLFRPGMCGDCAAKLMDRSREESRQATRELLGSRHAELELGQCKLCGRDQLVVRIRDS
jgi:hypothetical protein